MRQSALLASLGLTLGILGCSDSTNPEPETTTADPADPAPKPDEPGEPDAEVAPAAPESADAGPAEPSEPCADDEAASGELCVGAVRGSLAVDQGDLPPAMSQVTVCGAICYGGASDADGLFEVPVDRYLDPDDYSLLLHGAPTFAGFYYRVPTEPEDGVLDAGTVNVFRLPESGERIPDETTEAVTLTAQGVTLSLPAEVKAQFDFEAFGHGELGFEFRALELQPEAAALATDLEADVFYAFAPFETWFRELADEDRNRLPMRLSFPNTAQLEPDQAVEFLVLGSYLYSDYVPAAEFKAVATGAVSEDGKTIEMADGEGIELLTWVAIRRVDK